MKILFSTFLYFLLSGAAFAGPSLIDRPLPLTTDLVELDNFVYQIREGFTQQERLDWEDSIAYLRTRGDEFKRDGLLSEGYEKFIHDTINGLSPRRIMLVAAGMMLTECSGAAIRNAREDDARDYATTAYLGKLRARAVYMLNAYSAAGGR